jgi:hypothetical protein
VLRRPERKSNLARRDHIQENPGSVLITLECTAAPQWPNKAGKRPKTGEYALVFPFAARIQLIVMAALL